MALLTETGHAGEGISSQGNGNISFDEITVLSGQDLQPMTVVGKVTASGKYVILAPAAVDGSQLAAGLIFDRVDATGGDKIATLIARLCEITEGEVVWPAGITGPQKATATAQLAALFLIIRASD